MPKTVECPSCGKSSPVELDKCQWCHKPLAHSPSESPSQGFAVKRYADAYSVARAAAGFGSVVKIGAVVVGVLVVIASALFGSQSDSGLLLLVAGALAGVAFGFPIYILGVLISAVGQVLMATLDTAVNTSPILSTEEKVRAIGLY